MYLSRQMERQITEASQHYPVVMLCGARQVGKSTLLYHMMPQGCSYVTMDDANARGLAQRDPSLFLETYPAPLLIDEFQYAPGILSEIKKVVDELALKGQDNSGMYWLTGSQKFSMMKDVAESLAGRVAVLSLSSLSTAEIDNRVTRAFVPTPEYMQGCVQGREFCDVHGLYERIFLGGMPKFVTTGVSRERFYSDYVSTYLERDIRGYANIGKFTQFNDFLVYMAARTGREIRYNDIAQTIGVSAPTAKEWVSILEQSGIVYILRPYYTNITKRLIKTPKAYFMDTGLAAYLCGWPDSVTLERGPMDGAFLETYVVTQIIRSFENDGLRPPIYYYRDIDKREIDLLILNGDTLYPVEIKKSKTPAHPDKNFDVLSRLDKAVQPGVIACLVDKLVPYNRNLWLFPIAAL